MANNRITLGVGFNVDKSSLTSVKSELQQLKNMTAKDYIKIRPDVELGEAVQEVNKLKQSISDIEKDYVIVISNGIPKIVKFINDIKM